MSFRKAPFVYILAGILLSLVILSVLPVFLPWQQYRSPLESQASQLLGQPVSFRGDLKVRLFPVPEITVFDVHGEMPDGPWSVQKISARLDILSLFSGIIEVSSLSFKGVDLPEVSQKTSKSLLDLLIQWREKKVEVPVLDVSDMHLSLAREEGAPRDLFIPHLVAQGRSGQSSWNVDMELSAPWGEAFFLKGTARLLEEEAALGISFSLSAPKTRSVRVLLSGTARFGKDFLLQGTVKTEEILEKNKKGGLEIGLRPLLIEGQFRMQSMDWVFTPLSISSPGKDPFFKGTLALSLDPSRPHVAFSGDVFEVSIFEDLLFPNKTDPFWGGPSPFWSFLFPAAPPTLALKLNAKTIKTPAFPITDAALVAKGTFEELEIDRLSVTVPGSLEASFSGETSLVRPMAEGRFTLHPPSYGLEKPSSSLSGTLSLFGQSLLVHSARWTIGQSFTPVGFKLSSPSSLVDCLLRGRWTCLDFTGILESGLSPSSLSRVWSFLLKMGSQLPSFEGFHSLQFLFPNEILGCKNHQRIEISSFSSQSQVFSFSGKTAGDVPWSATWKTDTSPPRLFVVTPYFSGEALGCIFPSLLTKGFELPAVRIEAERFVPFAQSPDFAWSGIEMNLDPMTSSKGGRLVMGPSSGQPYLTLKTQTNHSTTRIEAVFEAPFSPSFLQSLAGEGVFKGEGMVSGKVEATGLSEKGMLSTLTGSGTFTLADGQLLGLDKGRLLSLLGALPFPAASSSLSEIKARLEDQGFIDALLHTSLSNLSLTFPWRLEQGLLRGEPTVFKSDQGDGMWSMFVDFPSLALDMTASLPLSSPTPSSPRFELTWSGPFSKLTPQYNLETLALYKTLLEYRADLERLSPDSSKPDIPNIDEKSTHLP